MVRGGEQMEEGGSNANHVTKRGRRDDGVAQYSREPKRKDNQNDQPDHRGFESRDERREEMPRDRQLDSRDDCQDYGQSRANDRQVRDSKTDRPVSFNDRSAAVKPQKHAREKSSSYQEFMRNEWMLRHPTECAWDLLNDQGCVQGSRCRFQASHSADTQEVRRRVAQARAEWDLLSKEANTKETSREPGDKPKAEDASPLVRD